MNCFGGKRKKRVIECHPHQLYEENIRMKEKVHEMERKGNDVTKEIDMPSIVDFYSVKNFKVWRKYAKWISLGLFIVAAVFVTYFIWSAVTLNNSKEDDTASINYYLAVDRSVAIRQCRKEGSASTDFRDTFPDIDYAMLGYDIIKGFPDSNKHDPGFTYPIFLADYTNDRFTSDCRYSIPKGFVVIPDVSCVTSFVSTTIRNSLELQKSLAVSVETSGGYAGFSFSASSNYKSTSSELSTGEKVFVTSSAKCSNYFSAVDTTQPPPLNPGFLKWVRELQRNTSDEKLIQFVKHFGTHFPTRIVFGARYIRKHKMTTDTYKKASSRDVSVSAQASYSGIFSASGSFSLDKKQKRAASEFNEDVETTTVSVGASLPSDGNVTSWASSVMQNPVPISYELEPITELFAPVFMRGSGINYNLIKRKLKGIEKKYCQQLLQTGDVNTCDDTIPIGLRITNHLLSNASHPFTLKVSESSCISKCFDDRFCSAVSYAPADSTCTFHDGVTEIKSRKPGEKNNPIAIIFPSRVQDLKQDLEVRYLEVGDKARDGSKSVDDEKECRHACLTDLACDTFSFSHSLNRTDNCKLYSSKSAKNFQLSSLKSIKTYFIFRGNSTKPA